MAKAEEAGMSAAAGGRSTIDAGEVERFSRMAAEWWDPTGKFKPLHVFNPVRLGYIKRMVSAQFGADPRDPKGFTGLKLLDIGCGGGLLSEPMARLGAEVVGADASETNIEVARLHAGEAGLAIDYRTTTAEALAETGELFHVVLAMEIVEHVADMPLFIGECARMVLPGGLLLVATINRTARAYALAIVGAERVLRWLPPGTHHYDRLIRPDELEEALGAAGLRVKDRTGVVFSPFAGRWQESPDMAVNYMMLAEKPV